MASELLVILEQIEREKGIKKEILVTAVESALLSAARKVIDARPEEELRVELDPESGKIRVYKNNEEIHSLEFGRIAASCARQVIIQKIREAEKDVVFADFQGKVGEIVSGTVYRFEKGNIIIDLLGKAEGLLIKREQSSKEEFKQGQRIRSYVAQVRKDTKGPQIMLSRAHPNIVRKLFELEVPEIYEGIVEIKAIARQAGERTKIAVYSKNDKVDPVGACVGMRGNRVRNIVNELQGEKIDIVRYSEDIREYIKAALSPAKVAEIRLNKEAQKAEVIVENDQLSLAIGKHGQNVRLASRLINWELDIRTKETAAKAEEQKKPEALAAEPDLKTAKKQKKEKKEKKEKKAKQEKQGKQQKKQRKKKEEGPQAPLAGLPGIGVKITGVLIESGLKTAKDILKLGLEGLCQIKGIGQKKADKIIEAAKKSAA